MSLDFLFFFFFFFFFSSIRFLLLPANLSTHTSFFSFPPSSMLSEQVLRKKKTTPHSYHLLPRDVAGTFHYQHCVCLHTHIDSFIYASYDTCLSVFSSTLFNRLIVLSTVHLLQVQAGAPVLTHSLPHMSIS